MFDNTWWALQGDLFAVVKSLLVCVSMVNLQLVEAEWRIYASLNLAIIGSDNGLLPDRHQAIILTNAGILLIESWGTDFN